MYLNLQIIGTRNFSTTFPFKTQAPHLETVKLQEWNSPWCNGHRGHRIEAMLDHFLYQDQESRAWEDIPNTLEQNKTCNKNQHSAHSKHPKSPKSYFLDFSHHSILNIQYTFMSLSKQKSQLSITFAIQHKINKFENDWRIKHCLPIGINVAV